MHTHTHAHIKCRIRSSTIEKCGIVIALDKPWIAYMIHEATCTYLVHMVWEGVVGSACLLQGQFTCLYNVVTKMADPILQLLHNVMRYRIDQLK